MHRVYHILYAHLDFTPRLHTSYSHLVFTPRIHTWAGESKRRTTITIAHRLTTIRTSDKIAVVQKGRVIEHGTWEELMATGGVFFKLASEQETQHEADQVMMAEAPDAIPVAGK